jgi:hypothetical protein
VWYSLGNMEEEPFTPSRRKSSMRMLSNASPDVQPPKRLVRVTMDADDLAPTDLKVDTSDGSTVPIDIAPVVEATPRRSISFPGTPSSRMQQSLEGPPPLAAFSPSRARGAKAHILNYVRLTRREFFESIGPQRSAFSFSEHRACPLRCSALASLASALSYVRILGSTDAVPPSPSGRLDRDRVPIDTTEPLPVTVDRLMRACDLPFSSLLSNEMTVHTVFDIATRYMRDDPVLSDFTAVLEPMDLKITEVPTSAADDFDSAPREIAVDLKSLRQRLQETQSTHTFAVLVFYDHRIVEDSLSVEPDEDETVDIEMNKSFLAAVLSPSISPDSGPDMDFSVFRETQTKTDVAIVVGVTRNDRVQLAIPKFSESRSGMQIMEVSLPTLHRGMAAAHPYSKRANGFLVIRRPGALSPLLSPTANAASPTSLKLPDAKAPRSAPDDRKEGRRTPRPRTTTLSLHYLSNFGRRLASPEHVQLSSVSPRVGPHLTAIAIAASVLDGTAAGGINLNAVVRALKCPTELLVAADVTLEDVGSMCKNVFPAEQFNVSIVPFAQSLRKINAPCALPVSEFQSALATLRTVNESAEHAVMLAQFDAEAIHWSVGINDEARSHWGILTNYDEDAETVDVVDTAPSKFGFSWTVHVEQLHRSMTNLGFVLVSGSKVDIAPFLPTTSSVAVDFAQATRPYVSPLSTGSLQRVPACVLAGSPLSLLPVALASRFPAVTFVDVVSALPFSLAHLLDDRIGLQDFARCASKTVDHLGLAAEVVVHTLMYSLHDGCADDGRARFDALVASAATGSSVLIFNFMPSAMTGLHVRSLKGPPQLTDFALMTGRLADERIALLDTHPQASRRQWVAEPLALFDSLARVAPSTKRPLGIIEIKFGGANLKQPDAADSITVACPSLAPFLPHGLTSVGAIALAMTSLGAPTTAEVVLYTVLQRPQNAESARYWPSTVLTADDNVARTIEIVNAYAQVSGLKLVCSTVDINSEQDLENHIRTPPNGTAFLLLYNTKDVHTFPGDLPRSAGVLHGLVSSSDAEPQVVVAEASAFAFGPQWTRPLAEVAFALRGDNCGLLLLRLERDDSDRM